MRIWTSPRYRSTCWPNDDREGSGAGAQVAGRACRAATDPPTRRRSIESVTAAGGHSRALERIPVEAVHAQTATADRPGRTVGPTEVVTGDVADGRNRVADR